MLKGVKSRLSIHLILSALKNNVSNYDKLMAKEINQNQYSSRDINLIQTVVLNSLRYNNHIKIIIKKYVDKKVNEDSYLLLLSALTQLIFLDFKDYAVINSTVEVAKSKKLRVYPGFINAILKKAVSEKIILKDTKIEIEDLPNWFRNEIKNLDKKKKNQFIDIIIERPQIHLVFKDGDFLNKFLKEISTEYLITSKKSLTLLNSNKIEDLPRYKNGEWWIQDFSSMLPLYLAMDLINDTIIDLCAAPGGKCFQILSNKKNLTIVEKSNLRAKVLGENLQRLKFNQKIKILDALNIVEEKKYETVVVDAPCTSIGTIRKNPEIFFRTNKKDITLYTIIQNKLLTKAAKLTRNKGIIIYMVCSFFEKETTNQIDKFLEINKEFSIKKFKTDEYKGLIDNNGFINTIPTTLENNTKVDGFFAAILEKNE